MSAPAMKVTITGRRGQGKSTLASLIAGAIGREAGLATVVRDPSPYAGPAPANSRILHLRDTSGLAVEIEVAGTDKEPVAEPLPIWRVVIAFPGMNTDHYVASAERPTLAQLQDYWAATGRTGELKPSGWKGPLKDAYPGVGPIERINVFHFHAPEEV